MIGKMYVLIHVIAILVAIGGLLFLLVGSLVIALKRGRR